MFVGFLILSIWIFLPHGSLFPYPGLEELVDTFKNQYESHIAMIEAC